MSARASSSFQSPKARSRCRIGARVPRSAPGRCRQARGPSNAGRRETPAVEPGVRNCSPRCRGGSKRRPLVGRWMIGNLVGKRTRVKSSHRQALRPDDTVPAERYRARSIDSILSGQRARPSLGASLPRSLLVDCGARASDQRSIPLCALAHRGGGDLRRRDFARGPRPGSRLSPSWRSRCSERHCFRRRASTKATMSSSSMAAAARLNEGCRPRPSRSCRPRSTRNIRRIAAAIAMPIGCWRAQGFPDRAYAFSADGIYDRPAFSRRVTDIDFADADVAPARLRQRSKIQLERRTQRFGSRNAIAWRGCVPPSLAGALPPVAADHAVVRDVSVSRRFHRQPAVLDGRRAVGRTSREIYRAAPRRDGMPDDRSGDVGRAFSALRLQRMHRSPCSLQPTRHDPAAPAGRADAGVDRRMRRSGFLVRWRACRPVLPFALVGAALVVMLLNDASFIGGVRPFDGGDDGLFYEGLGRKIVQHLLAGDIRATRSTAGKAFSITADRACAISAPWSASSSATPFSAISRSC